MLAFWLQAQLHPETNKYSANRTWSCSPFSASSAPFSGYQKGRGLPQARLLTPNFNFIIKNASSLLMLTRILESNLFFFFFFCSILPVIWIFTLPRVNRCDALIGRSRSHDCLGHAVAHLPIKALLWVAEAIPGHFYTPRTRRAWTCFLGAVGGYS